MLTSLLPILIPLHYWLSRAGLVVALVMFVIGLFIGVVKKRDVTRWYRLTVDSIVAGIALQALIGLTMYAIGIRPAEEVHLVYGFGSLAALPFFIFVEVTAQKRPAMGSYLWGFMVLAGILVRAIMTGRAG